MDLIDWILNVAGVFLWIDWRSARAATPRSALSIASAVRPASPSSPTKGLGSLASLAAILLIRPLFYYSIGSAVNWIPALNFLAIAIPWRSDLVGRMFLFSFISFGKALGFYYAWLLLLSVTNRKVSDEDGVQRFVRAQLGWLERIPWWLKLLLPSIVAALAWVGLSVLFMAMGLLPVRPIETRWVQAGAFALAALLAWKWLLVTFFLVHMLNIYVYLGTHPAWAYVSVTARRLLGPLRFLQIGKLDLSPVIGAGVVLALAYWVIEPAVLSIFQRPIP